MKSYLEESADESNPGPSNLEKLKHVSYSVPVISVIEPSNADGVVAVVGGKLPKQSSAGTRQKKFYNYFYPLKEKVLQYYACAFTSEGLFQGHLYITPHHFAFYSHVLGFTKKFVIPVHTIDTIEKQYTAKFIPNAITISAKDRTYFFASFISRDTAHRFLCNVWEEKVGRKQGLEAAPSQNEDESGSDRNCLKVDESQESGSEESCKDSLEPESSPIDTTTTPSTSMDDPLINSATERRRNPRLCRMKQISQEILSMRDSIGQIKEPVKRYSGHLLKFLLIVLTVTLIASAVFQVVQISRMSANNSGPTYFQGKQSTRELDSCQAEIGSPNSVENALKCVRDNIKKVKDVRQTLEDLSSMFDSK